MRIEELTPEQSITFLVVAGSQQLEFPSKVLEVYPRKHFIIASPVTKDDKIISFNGKGILIHLIASFSDKKPQVFQNVTVRTAKRDDDSLCYTVTTIAESKELNRRGAYRCFIGIDTHIRIGVNHSTVTAIIKDVSITGFSFTVSSTEEEFPEGSMVHAVLNDYIEETAKNYSFHLFGNIVRHYQLETGSTVYGCQLTGKVLGLDKYLNEKERIRLRKTHGNTGASLRKK